MLTGLEKHLHSAIWASSRIILKLKTFIEIPTQIFSQWFETRVISAICPKVMSFLAFDMLFHISSWNYFPENISNEVVKEIFISVLSSDMAFISSFTFCATTLSHHTSQTPLFMCLQSQSHFERNLFNVFRQSYYGLFKHYKSGDQTENERKHLIQPIILFPVQSIGKYQIPSSRPPWFSFQGLKCGNAKGVGWKKIGQNWT